MVITEDARLREDLSTLVAAAGMRSKSIDLAARGTEPFQYGALPRAMLASPMWTQ